MGRKTNQRISQALIPLNKLLDRYGTQVPEISSLTEEKIAWINDQFQIIWENLKYTSVKEDMPYLKNIKDQRDTDSHKRRALSGDEARKQWVDIFPVLEKLKSKLNSVLQNDITAVKRRFIKSGPDTCGERKQLVKAIEDACDPDIADGSKVSFPENNLAQAAASILETLSADNSEYIANHPEVSDNIQKDLISWLRQVDNHLSAENPLQIDFQYVQQLKLKSADEILSSLDSILQRFTCLPSDSFNSEFYRKEIEKLESLSEKKEAERKTALASLLLDDLEKNILQALQKWTLDEIDRMRCEFICNLQENLKKYQKLEQLLSAFCDDHGILWDMSKGYFREHGFEILNTFAYLLEHDESLRELAEMLGKQDRLQKSYEIELRSKTVIKPAYHPRPAFKGQITGIRTTNDISSVLPSELALLHHPSTKKLFELKYAQQQLLSFKYENIVDEKEVGTEFEQVSREKSEEKGPIIICVDTSGSMAGIPEMVAKTITFALTKIALKEKRSCYLISFSTGIETLALSEKNPDGNLWMESLIAFLRMSFNGGTDAMPALHHALKMLNEEEYRNADILMVSDFIMPSPSPELREQIEAEKEKDTAFYNLVIGQSGRTDFTDLFTRSWQYNTSDKNSLNHLVEITAELRK